MFLCVLLTIIKGNDVKYYYVKFNAEIFLFSLNKYYTSSHNYSSLCYYKSSSAFTCNVFTMTTPNCSESKQYHCTKIFSFINCLHSFFLLIYNFDFFFFLNPKTRSIYNALTFETFLVSHYPSIILLNDICFTIMV